MTQCDIIDAVSTQTLTHYVALDVERKSNIHMLTKVSLSRDYRRYVFICNIIY